MAAQRIPSLILASASPRRAELLKQMGIQFSISAADIDESRLPNEPISAYVSRLAGEKAEAVASQHDPQTTAILAADTIVSQQQQVFGKPKDRQQAFEIWQQLAGTKHQVSTAVCLLHKGIAKLQLVTTDVEFSEIDEKQMQRYWASGEPQDKAGAYAIQGLASAWVKQINGSYSNVVGLPLRETNQLLQEVGHNWL